MKPGHLIRGRVMYGRGARQEELKDGESRGTIAVTFSVFGYPFCPLTSHTYLALIVPLLHGWDFLLLLLLLIHQWCIGCSDIKPSL